MNKLAEMIMPGDPLMLEAAEALRKFHEAKAASKSPQEVERLRLLAESLFQAINEFNLKVLGQPSHGRH